MRKFLFSLAFLTAFTGVSVHAEMPIVTDSRIKTFVYNPNEVYTITTHYGYQSNIEFGLNETIDTISVGDRVAWQIIPAGKRLFIRAMEENAHTNMTVVTNLRAYQLDLRSSSADAVFGSEELTYVVRFFYPEDGGIAPLSSRFAPPPAPMAVQQVSFTPAPPIPAPAPALVAKPTAPPMTTGAIPTTPANPAYNYRYTYSGPNAAAPVKIYDDGHTTYFKYPTGISPKVAVITTRGETLDVPTRTTADNTIAVDIIAPRFSLQHAAGQVIVYNESNGA